MRALLIIDVQNDFCKNGALEVPDANTIIPVINNLIDSFDIIIQTQDWHPAGHQSFASSHDGKEPFGTIGVDYGTQVLWPEHCVQGTIGAEFHPDLITEKSQVIIRKGFRKEIDSYSAFFENDQKTKTGLTGYLKTRGIKDLYAVGLATDFCVKWSVVDGLKEGFKVTVVTDAIMGIDIEGSVDKALSEMINAGASFTNADTLL